MANLCFCGDDFSSLDDLKQHLEDEGHRIRCHCGALRKTHEERRQHQSRDHTGGPYTYTIHPASGGVDQAQFRSSSSRTLCKLCYQGFRSEALVKHILDEHPTQTHDTQAGTTGSFFCKACPEKIFASARALEQHCTDKHRRRPPPSFETDAGSHMRATSSSSFADSDANHGFNCRQTSTSSSSDFSIADTPAWPNTTVATENRREYRRSISPLRRFLSVEACAPLYARCALVCLGLSSFQSAYLAGFFPRD